MFHLLHDFDLAMDVLEVVLIGEDTFVDDLYGSWAVIAQQSAEKDGGVGALAEELVHREDVLFYLLLTLGDLLVLLLHSR